MSGPEFFGYSYPEVAYLIEGLDYADMCKNYLCRKIRDNNRVQKKETPVVKNSDNQMTMTTSFAVKREAPSIDNMYYDKRLKQ